MSEMITRAVEFHGNEKLKQVKWGCRDISIPFVRWGSPPWISTDSNGFSEEYGV